MSHDEHLSGGITDNKVDILVNEKPVVLEGPKQTRIEYQEGSNRARRQHQIRFSSSASNEVAARPTSLATTNPLSSIRMTALSLSRTTTTHECHRTYCLYSN